MSFQCIDLGKCACDLSFVNAMQESTITRKIVGPCKREDRRCRRGGGVYVLGRCFHLRACANHHQLPSHAGCCAWKQHCHGGWQGLQYGLVSWTILSVRLPACGSWTSSISRCGRVCFVKQTVLGQHHRVNELEWEGLLSPIDRGCFHHHRF